jgi:hypothetical protein
MTPVQPRSSPTTSYRPSDGRGTSFPSRVPRHRLLLANGIVPTITLIATAGRRPWAPLAHVGVGGVLVDWIVVQLLVIGFLAPASQLGHLTLGLVILSL